VTEDAIPGGAWGALGLLLMGAAYFVTTHFLGKSRRDASDGAAMASDQARTDTYEMLTRQLESALLRAGSAEVRVAELQTVNARLSARLLLLANDARDLRRLIEIGASQKQVEDFFAESGLAEFDSQTGELKR
jgi:hypothetical protein